MKSINFNPDQDPAFKDGRGKTSGGTVLYSIPGVTFHNVTTSAAVANTDVYNLFFVKTPINVDQLAFEVTSFVSGNSRMGIYSVDLDWQPVGAPLVDSGDISTGSNGVKTFSTTLYLPRGRYATVQNFSTTPTCRKYSTNIKGLTLINSAMGANSFPQTLVVSRAYAAFPTPGTAWDVGTNGSTTGFQSYMVLRVSSP